MDTMDNLEIRKVSEEVSGEVGTATMELTNLVAAPTSRRRLLQRAAAGVAGVTAAGVAAATVLNTRTLHAQTTSTSSVLTEYFSILATGEALFVTFYSHGVANHEQLGINGSALTALKA